MPPSQDQPPVQSPGLRQRKNHRTRHAIVQAAVDLTIEGGWAAATIPRIAERADVSPRTVSTWFPVKEDILFESTGELVARATRHVRTGAGDVVDRLAAWIEDESSRPRADPDIARLRHQAIAHDPELRARDRQHLDRIRDEVAQAVRRDAGLPATDVEPHIFAGAVMAFLETFRASTWNGDVGAADGLARGFVSLQAILEILVPTTRAAAPTGSGAPGPAGRPDGAMSGSPG